MKPEDQVKDAPPPSAAPPSSARTPPTDVVREQDKLMLVFSYLSLLALVPLLTVNDSEYVRWHAKNGLVLTLGGAVVLSILGQISFIGWFACPGWVALLALVLVCVFRALQGVRLRIPIVSDLADKF